MSMSPSIIIHPFFCLDMGSCFGLFRNSTPLLDNSESDSSPSDVANFSSSQVPVFHLNPGLSIPASRLTEEEQIQIIKRMDMIQFLPSTTYVPIGKEKLKEYVAVKLTIVWALNFHFSGHLGFSLDRLFCVFPCSYVVPPAFNHLANTCFILSLSGGI
ncbi:unnamed protein product [Dicrocoelium dendriticum]|nr:unnamed protein product [Dicrocoelium dendriticum]